MYETSSLMACDSGRSGCEAPVPYLTERDLLLTQKRTGSKTERDENDVYRYNFWRARARSSM